MYPALCKYIELVIRITCPCNVYPLIPHFYIAKLRYAGVYLFSLGSNVYPQSMFCQSKNKKNIKFFLLKIFNFYSFRKFYILQGHVLQWWLMTETLKDRSFFIKNK